MAQTLRAVHEDGKFIPVDKPNLAEGADVRLTIESSSVHPPLVSDREERKRGIAALVERMPSEPMSADRPRRTREEMHDRR